MQKPPGTPRPGLRLARSLLPLLVVAALAALAPAPRGGATAAEPELGLSDGRDGERAALAELLNRQRAAQGLAAVRLTPALSRAAQDHAADMEARGYFAFTSPSGQQIDGWVKAAGYDAQLVTEKIARTDEPPAAMAAGWGRFPQSQSESLFHPEVEELGVGLGRQKGVPVYVFVLARSRQSYLADYTRRLFAEQTARFHDLDALRREMLTRVNAARAEHGGLPPLHSDPALDRAAQAYADEVFQARSAGRPLPPRGELAKHVQKQGYRIQGGVGEAVVEGALTPEATLDALLGGGDHRAQVLRKTFTDLGLGLAFERRGDGYFVVWVQCLARGGVTPEITLPPDVGRDPRLAWLRKNAIAVRTVDPADLDYRDLEPLRAVLGDARIVLLGEPSHGDGAVFRAKSRLVRFLHRQMGFSVLAFESGFYDCAKAEELLAGGEDAATAAARAVFGIWSGSAEVRPLLADLGRFRTAGAPLELAGFDSQFTGTASADFLIADLERYLRSIGAETASGTEWASLRGQLGELLKAGEPGAPVPDRAAQADFAHRMDQLDAAIAAAERKDHAAGAETPFWRQLIRSTKAEAEVDWGAAGNADESNRRRDRQMADNLLWLARVRYPGRKIVVWAATRHILSNPVRVTQPNSSAPAYPGGAAMGDEVRKALGKGEVYALGFTAAGGEWGKHWETPRRLPSPAPGSLEDLWSRAGAELSIVDFRKPAAGFGWLSAPLLARPLGYTYHSADWTAVLDGMMFLRTMTPATPAGKAVTPAAAPPAGPGGSPGRSSGSPSVGRQFAIDAVVKGDGSSHCERPCAITRRLAR